MIEALVCLHADTAHKQCGWLSTSTIFMGASSATDGPLWLDVCVASFWESQGHGIMCHTPGLAKGCCTDTWSRWLLQISWETVCSCKPNRTAALHFGQRVQLLKPCVDLLQAICRSLCNVDVFNLYTLRSLVLDYLHWCWFRLKK